MDQLDKLNGVIAVQCSDGNWNFDEYHFGLANGLLLAKAILIDSEPEFMSRPDEWLRDRKVEDHEIERGVL